MLGLAARATVQIASSVSAGSQAHSRLRLAKRAASAIKATRCPCQRRHRIYDDPLAVDENGSSRTVRHPSSMMILPAPRLALYSASRAATSRPRRAASLAASEMTVSSTPLTVEHRYVAAPDVKEATRHLQQATPRSRI